MDEDDQSALLGVTVSDGDHFLEDQSSALGSSPCSSSSLSEHMERRKGVLSGELQSLVSLPVRQRTPRDAALHDAPYEASASASSTPSPSSSASLSPVAPSALEWNNRQVCEWLVEQGLGELQSVFERQRVNGAELLALTSSSAQALGIADTECAAKLLLAILNLHAEHGLSLAQTRQPRKRIAISLPPNVQPVVSPKRRPASSFGIGRAVAKASSAIAPVSGAVATTKTTATATTPTRTATDRSSAQPPLAVGTGGSGFVSSNANILCKSKSAPNATAAASTARVGIVPPLPRSALGNFAEQQQHQHGCSE